jgi:DNA-binding response OmpR family regulator
MALVKILVVDDDCESRDLLSEFLGANGYAVDSVGDGIAAWEAFTEQVDRYGVIIADVRMPGRTGWELLRKVRQHNAKQRIILMSSFVSQADKELAEDMGAQGLLEKPFQLSELLRVIGELTSSSAVEIPS